MCLNTDAAGFGRNLSFHITVQSQYTNGSDFYSYAPTIDRESLLVNSKRENRITRNMLGGDIVQFTGKNFGNRWEGMDLIYYNPSTRQINFSCTIHWNQSNSTFLYGTLRPGIGMDLVMALVISPLRRLSQGADTFMRSPCLSYS